MKYLMYYMDGFVKKFPLDKSELTIGWNKDNDLSIDNELISGYHLRIQVGTDSISIIDLDSTNGTYYAGGKIRESVIRMEESFSAASVEFLLKEGDLDEFRTSEELIPIFNKIREESETRIRKRKTKYIKNIYEEILKQILRTGVRKNSVSELLFEISNYLSNISDLGSIFIITKTDDGYDFLVTIKRREVDVDKIERFLVSTSEIFESETTPGEYQRRKSDFYSFPFFLKNRKTVLIHIPEKPGKADKKILEFLRTLTHEIELISKMIEGNGRVSGREEVVIRNGNIVGGSKIIKNLIKQTEKISGSDLFILICGESGTGKELFARMIHERSSRKKEKYVAINCAAIPENLLEAELFGYEKGAFTDAHSKKKGKFELASGGTLVLDEIGDMPPTLQAKILRALQENEFYRVGGTIPVKVDLRIISLTNKDLKELIKADLFREDLYYRIVHHAINIPPLREREEDVSILINYFSGEFSRRSGKDFKGYSIKAQKALLGYSWPGNIRQLKNEINRIISLTDSDELINYDILSADIKEFYDQKKKTDGNEDKIFSESAITRIIRVLDENNWNKTHAAKELGMTYRGLHKKMLRLGIEKNKP